jgi:indolepyruvate ferredoxin oxidoreductase, beta subunit
MPAAVKELNIIITGVGGQGVVLMSEILGNAAVRDGLHILGSEVLGMSQRGGSVFSNIRLGDRIYGPMVPDGKCDLLCALEPSEALRNVQSLNYNSTVILNTRKVIPATVSLGECTYPELEQVVEKLRAIAGKVITLDAQELSEKAGSRQSVNVVMLGTLFGCGEMPIKVDTVKAVIRERFSAKVAEANIRAFDLGRQVCSPSSVRGGSS